MLRPAPSRLQARSGESVRVGPHLLPGGSGDDGAGRAAPARGALKGRPGGHGGARGGGARLADLLGPSLASASGLLFQSAPGVSPSRPGGVAPRAPGQVLAQQAAPFDLAASPPSVPAAVAIAAPSEFLFGGFAARQSAFCSPVLRLLRGRLPGGRTEGDAGAHGSSRASRARAARQPDAGAFRSWANVYLCTKVGWLGEEGLEVTPPTLFQLPCWRWTPEKHLLLCTQFLKAFSEHFRNQAKVETGVRTATSGQKILPCRWVSPPFIPDKTVGPPTPSNETLAGILLCRG